MYYVVLFRINNLFICVSVDDSGCKLVRKAFNDLEPKFGDTVFMDDNGYEQIVLDYLFGLSISGIVDEDSYRESAQQFSKYPDFVKPLGNTLLVLQCLNVSDVASVKLSRYIRNYINGSENFKYDVGRVSRSYSDQHLYSIAMSDLQSRVTHGCCVAIGTCLMFTLDPAELDRFVEKIELDYVTRICGQEEHQTFSVYDECFLLYRYIKEQLTARYDITSLRKEITYDKRVSNIQKLLPDVYIDL